MEAVLIRQGLWESVIFDNAGLIGDSLQTAREAWIKKRSAKKMAEARAEIILRVEDSQLCFGTHETIGVRKVHVITKEF